MELPYAIKRATSWYMKHFPGSEVVHLGEYRGDEAFYVKMPDGTVTGYPPVLLLRKGKAVEIIGEESLEIISSFRDPDESE